MSAGVCERPCLKCNGPHIRSPFRAPGSRRQSPYVAPLDSRMFWAQVFIGKPPPTEVAKAAIFLDPKGPNMGTVSRRDSFITSESKNMPSNQNFFIAGSSLAICAGCQDVSRRKNAPRSARALASVGAAALNATFFSADTWCFAQARLLVDERRTSCAAKDALRPSQT